ncbi:TadE family protein [Dorea sp. AGR2135]|uniref:TadE family protein n=1 Tax=Dorea sp. AGR2135 TaxID=1280669 RepID=UPI00041C8599|nr:TadE family protein [Dorea sp. AGR2135]
MRGYTVEMSFLMPIIMLLVMSSIYAFFYYHDKNIIAGAAYETAVVGSNKARERPGSQTGTGDKSGTDAAELETLFQSRVNGKCILLSTIQGQVTVEGDEVCVRAQGTWRKMKVSVEKRAAITEPEKKLRDIKKIKEFVNGT